MTDFYAGEIILIDKPQHWTSFDVVNKLRIALKQKFGKKIKLGHAGTLDPLATGLLILCSGQMTKKIQSIADANKRYQATIVFGATRPSFDMETEIDHYYVFQHINTTILNDVLKTFVGKQLQMPPVFSAKKINGQKSYEMARKGKTIELKPAEIEIFEINILENNLPHSVKLEMLVSKGTYIRSFANDLGKKLNSGAYLSQLRRIAIGDYSIDDALTIEQFINNLSKM